MNSKQRLRARFILGGIIFFAGVLVAGLYSTAIIKGPDYAAKAQKQYARPSVALFDRGTIFFSAKDGTKPAAATVARGYLVYMNPLQIVDPAQTYEALSEYLKLDHDSFMKMATKKDPYEELAHHVDETVADSISVLTLKGIGVTEETWRTYPGDDLASHEVGILGETASSSIEGRYGLERTYEDLLSRPDVGSNASVFAGLFSGIRDSVFGGSKDHGDIVTTIEPTVQGYLQKVLGETSDTWHPDEIGGIIMDPNTGEIVALGSLPTFDPNNLSTLKSASVLSNPLVEHVYEMGSIVKPLTMAAALDSGAETPTSTYDDTGTMTLDGKKIANYDGVARGPNTPMQTILSQSLNIGAATIALKTGHDTFTKYFESYGFGDKTGVDLPNEAKGIIGNLNSGRDIEIATAAYGQGIAMSPVDIARGLSILANGGYVVTPYLVKEIDYTDGSTQMITPKKSGPVLKKQTTDEVTKMLVQVVDTALKNGAIKKDHYSIAAKTGTAQIADHVNGGYYSDRYLHSFFGYFPAYNPKFIIFLYQIYPKGAEYASATLTDPFDELATFLIDYYNIPPDR